MTAPKDFQIQFTCAFCGQSGYHMAGCPALAPSTNYSPYWLPCQTCAWLTRELDRLREELNTLKSGSGGD